MLSVLCTILKLSARLYANPKSSLAFVNWPWVGKDVNEDED